MTEKVAACCRHCRSTRIDAEIEWTGASYGSASIEFGADGRPTALVDAYGAAGEWEETGIYRCADCGAEDSLEGLIAPLEGRAGTIPTVEQLVPGLTVVLPDGLRGYVATVEPDGEAFTVDGWHEQFSRVEARLHPAPAVAA